MSGNIIFLGKKIFEISPFFQTRPGDLGKKVHVCSLLFSALKVRDREGEKKEGDWGEKVRLSRRLTSLQRSVLKIAAINSVSLNSHLSL